MDTDPGRIAIDLDETAAHVKKLREHAAALERHGQIHPSIHEALNTEFGPIHDEWVQAKKWELDARTVAYKRVADRVGRLADNHEQTAKAFSAQDDANAASIRAIDV